MKTKRRNTIRYRIIGGGLPHPKPNKKSTENLLINAANVDPFLEGRRPRHLWSHQLSLRATPPTASSRKPLTSPAANAAAVSKDEPLALDATEDATARATHASLAPRVEPEMGGEMVGEKSEGGLGQSLGQSVATSCLGVGGERGLFESLSAGAEGAFVVWVKGGHETRQECKRLVTDVLDLLAAPGGQKEVFFRRGVQGKGPPRGRVGIAAKISTETAASAQKPVPVVAKQTASTAEAVGSALPKLVPAATAAVTRGGGGAASHDEGSAAPVVEDGAFDCSTVPTTDNIGAEGTNNLDRGAEERRGGGRRREEGEGGGREESERGLTRKGEDGEDGEGGEGGGGGGGGGAAVALREDGRRHREAAGGQRPGTTYGYASLRKIREQEPLPTVNRLLYCAEIPAFHKR